MKSIIAKYKKYLVPALVLVGILGVSLGALAQSGSDTYQFFTENGLQTKYGRLVVTDSLDSDPSAGLLSALPDLKLYIDSFSNASDGFTNFSNVLAKGEVHIASDSAGPVYARFGSSSADTSARVSVAGNVLAKNFTDVGNEDPYRYLCADENGVVILCNFAGGSGDTPPDGPACASFPGTYSSQPADETNGCNNGFTYLDTNDSSTTWGWYCGYTLDGVSNYTYCSAAVAEETPETYSWNSGDWGSCTATPGSCSGSWTTVAPSPSTEVDWNGNSFDWSDGNLYVTTSNVVAFCGANNDMQSGENVHSNAGTQGTACFVQADPFPSGVMYEVSADRGMWDRIVVDSSGVITSVTQDYAPAYSSNGEEVIHSCSDATSSSTCTSQNAACSWTPGSGATETRSVWCEDSNGNTVSSDLCSEPAPATSQSCELPPIDPTADLTEGCYPIEYSELGGSYSNANSYCSSRTTKTSCQDGYVWNQAYGGGSSPYNGTNWDYPQFAAEPYSGWEFDYAINSYGDTSATFTSPGDLDNSGTLLPYYSDECSGSASNYSGCFRTLGPVCVWGYQ